MTVASETYRSGPYSTNGATTNFAYTFKILDEEHLSVVKFEDSTGIETTLTVNVDYTVTDVGETSGDVVISPALASGFKIYIKRDTPLTQGTSLSNQGGWYPKTHEEAFDKFVMMSQMLQEQIDRCAKSPVSGGTSGTILIPGAGSPEGVVDADVGSAYLRTDGGSSTTLYIKESGSGNTGWVAK